VAQRQKETDEAAAQAVTVGVAATPIRQPQVDGTGQGAPMGIAERPGASTVPSPTLTTPAPPKRFHGSVELDPARVGRDAGRIADELIVYLAGLIGANVRVTLEIEADVPAGVPEHVVRTVTENGQTLKFTSQGFEVE